MHYVYILKSLKDYKLYIGYSSDLKQRVEDHINGRVESTRNRRPLELIYYEACKSDFDAKGREWQLKKFGRAYSQLKKRISKSIE